MSRQYFYNNITNLRSDKTVVEITEDQIKTFERVKNDIIFFAENFYLISGEKIKLYDYQKEILTLIQQNNRVVGNLSKCIGETTTISIYILWYILTHNDENVGILSNSIENSRLILSNIKKSYINLPLWLQSKVRTWNVNRIILDNGCGIIVSNANGNSFLGDSINLLYVNNAAFINKWDEILDSVLLTIYVSRNSQIIITSTPHGNNHFYELVKNTKLGLTDFINFELKWNVIPGRDEKWRQTQLDSMLETNRELIFKQNYECEFISEDNNG